MFMATEANAANRCLNCHTPHDPRQTDCVVCHHGNPETSRKKLAHTRLIDGRHAWFAIQHAPVTQAGERLMKQLGCRRCHISGGKGTGLATNLDGLLPDVVLSDLHLSLMRPVTFMPAFHLAPTQRITIITVILAGGACNPLNQARKSYRVVFTPSVSPQGSQGVFVKHCGGCHKALTVTRGALGHGNTGPNLSGLFSQWYPSLFPEWPDWTPERLKGWMKNPRVLKPKSSMPPRALTDQDFDELVRTLQTPIRIERP